jgi:hypothetical protein
LVETAQVFTPAVAIDFIAPATEITYSDLKVFFYLALLSVSTHKIFSLTSISTVFAPVIPFNFSNLMSVTLSNNLAGMV